MVKIGIFGGTFNPPHVGHLRLAEEVLFSHGLSRIVFIPSFISPHKNSQETAAPEDRLEMIRRSCADNDVFEVSDIEISFQGPSYTVNTLEVLSKDRDLDPYFILGTDSLREIRTWKDYSKLFSLSHFIAVKRPGLDFATAWAGVPEALRSEFQDRGDHLLHSSSRRVIPSNVEGLNISSTMIRDLSRDGRSIRYLVRESVRQYILERKLYRN
ncbi:MAG: nicotinate-nucleotide adenylyltransferase [Desulfomonilaceae bacterium]